MWNRLRHGKGNRLIDSEHCLLSRVMRFPHQNHNKMCICLFCKLDLCTLHVITLTPLVLAGHCGGTYDHRGFCRRTRCGQPKEDLTKSGVHPQIKKPTPREKKKNAFLLYTRDETIPSETIPKVSVKTQNS